MTFEPPSREESFQTSEPLVIVPCKRAATRCASLDVARNWITQPAFQFSYGGVFRNTAPSLNLSDVGVLIEGGKSGE